MSDFIVHVKARIALHAGGTKFYETIQLTREDADIGVIVRQYGKKAQMRGAGATKIERFDVNGAVDQNRRQQTKGKSGEYTEYAGAIHGFYDGSLPTFKSATGVAGKTGSGGQVEAHSHPIKGVAALEAALKAHMLDKTTIKSIINDLEGRDEGFRPEVVSEGELSNLTDVPETQGEEFGIMVAKAAFGFVDDEVYPPQASALGINAYHIHACPVLGQSQPYCACLKRLAGFEAGESMAPVDGEFYRDCKRAWGGPACQAWVMRTEEYAANKALYFINRKKLNEYNGLIATDRARAPLVVPESVSRSQPTPTQPAPVKTAQKPAEKVSAIMQADYASAINAELKTLSTPAPAVQSSPIASDKPAMLPGETPLQYIRRLKAEQRATSE